VHQDTAVSAFFLVSAALKVVAESDRFLRIMRRCHLI